MGYILQGKQSVDTPDGIVVLKIPSGKTKFVKQVVISDVASSTTANVLSSAITVPSSILTLQSIIVGYASSADGVVIFDVAYSPTSTSPGTGLTPAGDNKLIGDATFSLYSGRNMQIIVDADHLIHDAGTFSTKVNFQNGTIYLRARRTVGGNPRDLYMTVQGYY